MTDSQAKPGAGPSQQSGSTETMPVNRERIDRIAAELRTFDSNQLGEVENFVKERKSKSR